MLSFEFCGIWAMLSLNLPAMVVVRGFFAQLSPAITISLLKNERGQIFYPTGIWTAVPLNRKPVCYQWTMLNPSEYLCFFLGCDVEGIRTLQIENPNPIFKPMDPSLPIYLKMRSNFWPEMMTCSFFRKWPTKPDLKKKISKLMFIGDLNNEHLN